MRAWLLGAIVLVVGCVTPADDAPAVNQTPVDATPTPDQGASVAAPPMGERMPATTERFVMQANQTLGVLRPGDPELAIAKVPQTLSATAFWESFATPLSLPAWPSYPIGVAFETTGDVEIALSFSVDAPATSTNPRAAGFPPVGLWFGTLERQAFFLLVSDAPDTLEAGKVYTVRATARPPTGGFFVREGEQLALHPFLSYQTADGRAPSFVVGGPEPAGFLLPHEHFNLSAPRAIVLVDETGELAPNPGFTGDTHQDPIDVPFTVPPEALYVVLEVSGAPKAGSRIDVDGSIRTPGGETIAGGSSPNAQEVAAIGPSNLKAFGRDLVAHVTASAAPAGGTFALKVTAYAPAP